MKPNKIAFTMSLILTVVLLSCNDEGVSQEIKLEDVDLVETKSTLKATLFTVSGVRVTESSQIVPSTNYRLDVESDKPMSFKIKSINGFEVIKGEGKLSSLAEKTTFIIRTNNEVGQKLFFSTMPIYKADGRLVKERTRMFLLPE